MTSKPLPIVPYYSVYNGHGDVVALTDAQGTVVANYTYDAWGVVTSASEAFPVAWVNPYLYDGRDRVRYDQETGLYWLSVRAYDPSLGRIGMQGQVKEVVVMVEPHMLDRLRAALAAVRVVRRDLVAHLHGADGLLPIGCRDLGVGGEGEQAYFTAGDHLLAPAQHPPQRPTAALDQVAQRPQCNRQ